MPSPIVVDPSSTRTVLPEKNLPPSISKAPAEFVERSRPKSSANPVQANAATSTLVPRSSQPQAPVLPPPPITVPSQSPSPNSGPLFLRFPPPRSKGEIVTTAQTLIRHWMEHSPPESWLVLHHPWDSYYKDRQSQVKTLPGHLPWPQAPQASSLYTIRQYLDGTFGLNNYPYTPQASLQAVSRVDNTPQEPRILQATQQNDKATVHLPQSGDEPSLISPVTTPQRTGTRAPHDADTKSLAKDVLRALGYSSKRLKVEDPHPATPGSLKLKIDSTPLAEATSSLVDTNLHESSIVQNVQNEPSTSTLSEDGVPSQPISLITPLFSVSEVPDNSSAPSQYTNLHPTFERQNTEAHPSTPLQQSQVFTSNAPIQSQVPLPDIPHMEDFGSTNMPKPAEALVSVELLSQNQYHADRETVNPSSEIPIVAMPTTPPATPPSEQDQPGQSKMPLFYPSPSSSPSRIDVSSASPPRSPPVSEGDTHGVTALRQRRRARIRKKVYVLVPMLPYEVQRDPLTGVLRSTSRKMGRDVGDEGLPQNDEHG
jgi:hypothetical protein